jgi:zinc transporter ZupT
MNEDAVGFVFLAFALAVGGGVLGVTLGTSHRRLCALISLGAGSLLGVTLFAILPEILETLHWWELVLGLASGYVLFALVSKYIFHVCPACAASHFDEATTHHFNEIASAMMLALSIHCVVDGLAMAAGGETHEAPAATQQHATGLSIILAVCVHKVPEGLALGALLLGAGLSRKKCIAYVASVEATTLLGGAAGFILFPNASPVWLAIALAHAGGGFLFLATHAMLGEIVREHKGLVLGSFAAGLALIGGFVIWLR